MNNLNFKKIKYFSLLLLVLYFSYCTTTKTTTTGEYVPPPDVKKDSLKVDLSKEAERVKEKVPAVFPKEERVNYKIQVFVSKSKETSDNVAKRIITELTQPAEVVSYGDLWKVQVGAFVERKDAEMMRDKFKNLGWNDAFVISVSDESFVGVPSKTELKFEEYFSVQVIASESREEARKLLKNLIELGFNDSFIVLEDNLWKVRVGKLYERTQVEGLLEKLKNIGFADCWIVKSNK